MKNDYKRQNGIINVNDFGDNTISIFGCGAIGSYVATSLSKMGLKSFVLWDDDVVEIHNLPNQYFTYNDLGKPKVEATMNHMMEFNNEAKILKCSIKFTEKNDEINTPIVVCCVDKMEARKLIFEKCGSDVQIFIDTRMGGLQGQVYTVDMTDNESKEQYKKTLFSSKEAVQMRCSERSIIFTVLGISSLVCNQIVKAFKDQEIINYIVLDYSVPQMM